MTVHHHLRERLAANCRVARQGVTTGGLVGAISCLAGGADSSSGWRWWPDCGWLAVCSAF